MKTLDEMKLWLKENLNEERYSHTLGVADTAKDLAKKYDLDEEKAYIAGLLHDCAKCYKNDDLYEILTEKMHYDMNELLNPKTYHSPAGAYLAKELFGVEDEEILSAISSHTIGRENMTTFEKVVFLADKIEPNSRDANLRKHMLEEVLVQENGLNKALLECYEYTIKSLIVRELKISLTTIKIYNELLDNVNA